MSSKLHVGGVLQAWSCCQVEDLNLPLPMSLNWRKDNVSPFGWLAFNCAPRTCRGQVMREALQVEGSPAAHNEIRFQERLQGYDDTFPGDSLLRFGSERGCRAAVHGARDPVQPAMRDILFS